jgi:hypothetical protein
LAQFLLLARELLQLLLLLLQQLRRDARRVRLRAEQQIPELFRERRRVLFEETGQRDLQVARI